jgi:hypothetical protein
VPWPYPFTRPARAEPARVDGCLPCGAWCLEHHGVEVPAAPGAALAAALAVGLRDVPLVRALLVLRGLPHDAGGHVGAFFSTPPFLVLDEEPGREVVFGVAGPFWQWRRGSAPGRVPRTPTEFRAALAEGRIAAIGNFRADPLPGGARLWTETWVSAPRRGDRLVFFVYWTVVGPFSAWIRRLLLGAARRKLTARGPPG